MKIRKLLLRGVIGIWLTGCILLSTAQGALQWENIPPSNHELTSPKARMLADLDTLEQFLVENWAERELNFLVYGIDIKERFMTTREKITDETTPYQYFMVINELLSSLQGSHLGCTFPPEKVKLYDLGGEETSPRRAYGIYSPVPQDAQEINKDYRRSLLQERRSQKPLLGPSLLYWDGDYYLRAQFRTRERSFPAGMKLLRINGRPVNELVKENQNQLCKYDFDRKQFYGLGLIWWRGDNFYEILPNIADKPIEFVFSDAQGIEVPFTLNPGERVRSDFGKNFLKNPYAVYLEEPQILYCHIPKMTNYKRYWKEIQDYREMPIKAIIIDIRQNPGGGDSCWMDLLGVLMAEPSKCIFELAHTDSPLQKIIRKKGLKDPLPQFFKQDIWQINWEEEPIPAIDRIVYTRRLFQYRFSSELNFEKPIQQNYWRDWTPEPIPLLNNTLMLRRDYQFSVEPKAESLNFTGPIYILCREIFSASGKLQVFATASDQLITVGERNPMMIGEGSRPAMFCLPESRIFGSIKLVVNLKGAKVAEDILHTRPEVELKLTLDEALELWNQNIELPLEERMMQSDPYIRKVLELEKERQSQVAP